MENQLCDLKSAQNFQILRRTFKFYAELLRRTWKFCEVLRRASRLWNTCICASQAYCGLALAPQCIRDRWVGARQQPEGTRLPVRLSELLRRTWKFCAELGSSAQKFCAELGNSARRRALVARS